MGNCVPAVVLIPCVSLRFTHFIVTRFSLLLSLLFATTTTTKKIVNSKKEQKTNAQSELKSLLA